MAEGRLALAQAFVLRQGWPADSLTPLAGDASARRYFRLTDGARRAVLMDAAPSLGEDTGRFCAIANWLLQAGYSAPRIFAADPDQGFLLLEDLGDDLLARLVRRDPAAEQPLYLAATDFLASLHRQTPPADLAVAQGPALAELVTKLLDWYLPALGLQPNQAARSIPDLIASDYQRLAGGPVAVSLRDFHAENLLWLPDRAGSARLGLLDFQDAFVTHPAYDLVSLLQDVRRDVSAATEAACLSRYAEATGQDMAAFRPAYALIGVQRGLRIMAVFARLCLRGGKTHYLDYMPRVWAHIRANLATPELAHLCQAVLDGIPEPTPETLQRIKAQCGQHPDL